MIRLWNDREGELSFNQRVSRTRLSSRTPDKAREKCRTAQAVLSNEYKYLMQNPIFVAFATQKGGAGKSTLTTLVASYLYYVHGKKVVAMDCDPRQHSMVEYRLNDKLMIKENPALKRKFTRAGKNPYPIVRCTPGEAFQKAQEIIDSDDAPDYVFFDITGTVNDRDIVRLISAMDYLFVPITPETGDLKSSIGFAHRAHETMLLSNGAKVKGMYLVWNKVQPRDRNNLCQIINRYAATLGIESLDTILPLSVKYTKDGGSAGVGGIFRSTYLPPDKPLLRNSYLPELVEEIEEIITSE